MTAARFLVAGRVQGVAFRAYTRQEAVALGLRGHAVNLPDGRVEVLAMGDADAIDRLGAWLAKGSPMARVDEVLREDEVLRDEAQDDAETGVQDGFLIG